MKAWTAYAPHIVLIFFSLQLLVHTSTSFAQTKDVFAGDARLSTKHTVKLASRALSTSLPEIGTLCGVTLTLDPATPDELIVVVAHDRTMSDTLRAISALTRLEWKKVENAGAISYTLFQSPEAKAAAENSARLDAEKVAKQTLSDAKAIRNYSEMSQDTLLKQIADLNEEITREPSAERRGELLQRRRLTEGLQFGHVAAAAKLIDVVGEKPILDALNGRVTDYYLPAIPGKQTIPLVVEAAIADIKQKANPNEQPKEYNAYAVKIGPGQTPSGVSVTVILKAETANSNRSMSFKVDFPYGRVTHFPAETPNAPKDWKDVPALNQQVFVAVPTPPLSNQNSKVPLLSRFAESILYIDSQVPVDVVADAFPSDAPLGRYEADNIMVGEALNRLSASYKRRWTLSDGFVQLRSSQHDVEQRSTPPAGVMEQVFAKVDGGLFSFEDMLNLAALPENQFKTVQNLILGRTIGVYPSISSQALLNAIRKLPREQRNLASSDGLPLLALSAEQRAELIAGFVESGTGQSQLAATGELKPLDLSSGRLEIRESERKMYGSRTMNAAFRGPFGTKAGALQAVEQQKGTAQPEDIKPCIIRMVTIRIEGMPAISLHRIALPPQWLETKE